MPCDIANSDMRSPDQAIRQSGSELHRKSTRPQSLLFPPDTAAMVRNVAAMGQENPRRDAARGVIGLRVCRKGTFTLVPRIGTNERRLSRAKADCAIFFGA